MTTTRSRASRSRKMPRQSQPWDIDLFYDLAANLFAQAGRPGPAPRAGTSTPSTKFPTRAGSPIASSRGQCRSTKRRGAR